MIRALGLRGESVYKMSKGLGQYFTIDEGLQRKVCEWIEHRGSVILEPSVGMGHLLKKIYERDPEQEVVAVEIDPGLQPVLNGRSRLIRGDFLEVRFETPFRTIIGNPPYVKRSQRRNLYLDFVDRCHGLLEDDGEMIMILPSDFFKLTSSIPIIRKMLDTGTFTHVYLPESENLFEGASIHVVCFRYRVGVLDRTVWVNDERRYLRIRDGMVSFSPTPVSGTPLGDLFYVYVGVVSGCDEVFRHEDLGNVHIRETETKVSRFILYETLPEREDVRAYLDSRRETLMKRKIRKFDEHNWFQWGALRNIEKIRQNLGRPCIYVKTLTRSPIVAFPGVVELFGGSLICLIPRRELDPMVLRRVVEYLHLDEVSANFRSGGRFKIGQRHLCNLEFPE